MRKLDEVDGGRPRPGVAAFSFLATCDEELGAHPIFQVLAGPWSLQVLSGHQALCTWSAVYARSRATGLPRGVRPLLAAMATARLDARPLLKLELALAQGVPLDVALSQAQLGAAQRRFVEVIVEGCERSPAHALAVWRAALGGPTRWAQIASTVGHLADRASLPVEPFRLLFEEAALARTDQLQTVLLSLIRTARGSSPSFWHDVLGTAHAALVARSALFDAACDALHRAPGTRPVD